MPELDATKFQGRGKLTLREGSTGQQEAAALAASAPESHEGFEEEEYLVRLMAAGFSLWVRPWRQVDETWHRTRMGEGGKARASCYHAFEHRADEGETTRCVGHGEGSPACSATAPNKSDGKRRVRYSGDERYENRALKPNYRDEARAAFIDHLQALAAQGASVEDMHDTDGIAVLATALEINISDAVTGSTATHTADAITGSVEPYVTDSARWDAFVEWARRFYEWEGFAEAEINYKLEIGAALAEARTALLSDSPGWRERLTAAVEHPHNNLTHGGNWRLAVGFLDLVSSDDPRLSEGLRCLWDKADTTVRERVRGFVESVAETPLGVPESMASFLLMARDPRSHPFYQSRLFGRAYRFTNHPRPGSGAHRWEQYSHAVEFLDEFIRQAQDRRLRLRDRLDAQSLVWCVTRPDYMPEEWDLETLAELKAYRESGGDPNAGPPQIPAKEPGTGTAPDWPALAARLLWEPRHLEEIVADLEDKKQMIFYGPPGTGKTYVAKAIAEEYARAGGGAEIVQFQPSYSYEDFVEGFRPSLTDDGQPRFELTQGPLRRIAEGAAANPDATYVLVIDELNRGNVAKVFGELYFLLEYRDEAIQLQYGGEPFQLPKNLLFICTMNTADRSIALVDAALRRRFWFEGFFPDRPPIQGLLRRWLTDNQPRAEWVADLVDRANQHLADRDAAIGPSYFMGGNADLDEERVQRIWRRAVLPYVEEQCYGEAEKLAALGYDRLRSELDAATTPPAEAQSGDEDAAADSPSDSDDDAPS